ncbi:hypothetical protein B0H17DRAFT_1127749 [Mycena rosella]|uniref:Uncharacterized protein n=1 Tax=Mycena rosella TaxID=1033263 RepID=A0AAD7E002_MYCRO|nr:hypothetical protein B0H17DRAFT_1127749 [Mycena rosella]
MAKTPLTTFGSKRLGRLPRSYARLDAAHLPRNTKFYLERMAASMLPDGGENPQGRTVLRASAVKRPWGTAILMRYTDKDTAELKGAPSTRTRLVSTAYIDTSVEGVSAGLRAGHAIAPLRPRRKNGSQSTSARGVEDLSKYNIWSCRISTQHGGCHSQSSYHGQLETLKSPDELRIEQEAPEPEGSKNSGRKPGSSTESVGGVPFIFERGVRTLGENGESFKCDRTLWRYGSHLTASIPLIGPKFHSPQLFNRHSGLRKAPKIGGSVNIRPDGGNARLLPWLKSAAQHSSLP